LFSFPDLYQVSYVGMHLLVRSMGGAVRYASNVRYANETHVYDGIGVVDDAVNTAVTAPRNASVLMTWRFKLPGQTPPYLPQVPERNRPGKGVFGKYHLDAHEYTRRQPTAEAAIEAFFAIDDTSADHAANGTRGGLANACGGPCNGEIPLTWRPPPPPPAVMIEREKLVKMLGEHRREA
jgi:hypothetical protein